MPAPLELRASNAHRWLVCHGQPRAVATLSDESSTHADRGTVAHGLLEHALIFDLEPEELWLFEGKLIDDCPQIPVDEEMIRGVSHALEYVRVYRQEHKKVEYHSEYEVTFSKTFSRWPIGGTSDIILHATDETCIVDYKHGTNSVDEENNPQLMTYALAYVLKHNIKPKRVRLVIIQPRARDDRGPVRETVITMKELLQFGERLKHAAEEAHKPNPTRVAGGHCRYCRAAGKCRAYADHATSSAALEFDRIEEAPPAVADMSDEDMARVLGAAATLRAWLDQVEVHAIARILDGDGVPGYKVVASRVQRKWADPATVLDTLADLADNEADVDRLAPRVPLSPSKLSKLAALKRNPDALAQHLWENAEQHVTTNAPQPRVAPLDDPRAPWRPGDEFTTEE